MSNKPLQHVSKSYTACCILRALGFHFSDQIVLSRRWTDNECVFLLKLPSAVSFVEAFTAKSIWWRAHQTSNTLWVLPLSLSMSVCPMPACHCCFTLRIATENKLSLHPESKAVNTPTSICTELSSVWRSKNGITIWWKFANLPLEQILMQWWCSLMSACIRYHWFKLTPTRTWMYTDQPCDHLDLVNFWIFVRFFVC